MGHAQNNIVRFFSKLNELRKEKKFTDVTILCESESFECHRLVLSAVSPYFETMFGSSFKESTSESIVLQEVSAATFEEVLHFMYTGDVRVKASNVYDLIRVSDYYNLPGIEDLCRRFIAKKSYKMGIENILPMFLYAYNTQKYDLMNTLNPRIADSFNECCKLKEFLEISFDHLLIIIREHLPLLLKNEELFLTNIIQWMCYKREERLQRLDDFFRVIQFQSMSSAHVKFITQIRIAEQNPVTVSTRSALGYHTVLELQKDKILKSSNGLHFYVKYEEQSLIQIFTVNNFGECTDSGEISVTDRDANIRCAVSDDHLYCLNYLQKVPNEQNRDTQTFCAHTSVDRRVTLKLTPPPLLLRRVFLCYLRNNIYAYDMDGTHYSVVQTNSKSCSMFNDEEINRRIFVYNCSLDNWFPVPPMRKLLCRSCMTVCDDTLYLIGGSISHTHFPSDRHVQALDFRAGWRNLPATHNRYYRANCCPHNGKIYICGGDTNGKSVERYDPIASKWEKIQSMDDEAILHRMVPFNDKLWIMGSHFVGIDENNEKCLQPSKDLSINVYDIAMNMWSKSTILSEAAGVLMTEPTAILDCVVFDVL